MALTTETARAKILTLTDAQALDYAADMIDRRTALYDAFIDDGNYGAAVTAIRAWGAGTGTEAQATTASETAIASIADAIVDIEDANELSWKRGRQEIAAEYTVASLRCIVRSTAPIRYQRIEAMMRKVAASHAYAGPAGPHENRYASEWDAQADVLEAI